LSCCQSGSSKATNEITFSWGQADNILYDNSDEPKREYRAVDAPTPGHDCLDRERAQPLSAIQAAHNPGYARTTTLSIFFGERGWQSFEGFALWTSP
jgi:hypothetical protein